jgi:hypothetical protein
MQRCRLDCILPLHLAQLPPVIELPILSIDLAVRSLPSFLGMQRYRVALLSLQVRLSPLLSSLCRSSIFGHPARGLAWISTLSILGTGPFALPLPSTSTASNFSKVSHPSITLPKTVFFPSSDGCGANVRKNWLPFVSLPLFAMLSTPLALCRSAGRISSSKGAPKMDGEDLDLESVDGEPVWRMKVGIMRWNGEEL